MKASVVDLRYKMNDVLKALDRNEEITILYRGKVKGILISSKKKTQLKMTDHPFFGMFAQADKTSVQEEMDGLRRARYSDI
jgi:hypothetical protein